MRKVALVGFNSRTLKYAKDIPDDTEIWTLNWAWQHEDVIPRIDRLFEIHPRKYLTTPTKEARKHFEKLTNETHPYPVYVIEEQPDIHNSTLYPYDEIVDKLCTGLDRGGKTVEVFTSTFDYMMALAIYEGVDEIWLYGCEMDTQTEYGYQQPGFAYWLGQAVSRGIKVHQPDETVLLRTKPYHKGGQMLGRQTVEAYKNSLEMVREQLMAQHNARLGQFQLMAKWREQGKEVSDEEMLKVGEELRHDESQINSCLGGLAIIEELFKEFDQDDRKFEFEPDTITRLNGDGDMNQMLKDAARKVNEAGNQTPKRKRKRARAEVTG